MAKNEPEVTVDTFTKEQLMASKRFAARKDALKALLDDDTAYTIEQAENIIENYMKGKVI